ncbi:hypothetical protein [Myceligenerans halotolerans]
MDPFGAVTAIVSAVASIAAVAAGISQITARARYRHRSAIAREMATAETSKHRRSDLERITIEADAIVVGRLCVSSGWFLLPLPIALFAGYSGYVTLPGTSGPLDIRVFGLGIITLTLAIMMTMSLKVAAGAVLVRRRIQCDYLIDKQTRASVHISPFDLSHAADSYFTPILLYAISISVAATFLGGIIGAQDSMLLGIPGRDLDTEWPGLVAHGGFTATLAAWFGMTTMLMIKHPLKYSPSHGVNQGGVEEPQGNEESMPLQDKEDSNVLT